MAVNQYKEGTDAYKFFDALSEQGQSQFLKNSYAVMTLEPIINAIGLDAALKNPENLIFGKPGVSNSKGSYEAWVAEHPDMSLLDSVKGTLKAAAPFALALVPGAGAALGSALGASGAVATGLGNAIIQGTIAEATGGDFLKSAALSGLGSLAGGVVQPGLAEATGSNAIASALTGGAMSEIAGGNFLQGAIQGGISGLTQDAKLDLAGKYIDAVNPGIGYDPATSPTELDVINAYPELAPEFSTQGVTDILNYAANAPSVQVAGYLGDIPNSVYDSSTDSYMSEIIGKKWTAQDEIEYQRSLEENSANVSPPPPTEQDLIDAFPELNQTNDPFVFMPTFTERPQSVQNVVNAISADVSTANPSLSAEQVKAIVEGSISNLPPGLSANDVQQIVTNSLSNLPASPTQQDIINIIGGQGLASTDQLTQQGKSLMDALQAQGVDYQTALSQALNAQAGNFQDQLSNVQAGLGNQITNLSQQTQQQLAQQSTQTQQQFQNLSAAQQAQADALVGQGASFNTALSQVQSGLQNQIGGVQAGLESQLSSQGKQFMTALQAQGVDYQTALNQAVNAQSNQFNTSIQDVVNQIGNVQTGLESQFQTGLQDLANQLGITQQDLINQLSQTQESFGTDIGNLQNQFTTYDEANAARYADLIKTVGLVGTGLGSLTSMFNTFQEQNTPKQYEIVAPPTDWASPTYGMNTNMQYSPGTPVDFGSANLLQGTQFNRPAVQATQMPYDLSNVINTLNYKSVPFVQQQAAPPSFAGFANQPTSGIGLNDIIGKLNGQQVSINDIISNIQGQYGQKAAS